MAHYNGGKQFMNFRGNYRLKAGNFRGDFVGIFTYNDDADAGYLDIDSFNYNFKNR
jgi:hypothetical protein